MKNTENNNCWKECRETWTCTLLVGNQNGTATLESRLIALLSYFYKMKRISTIWSSNSTPKYIPKKDENI